MRRFGLAVAALAALSVSIGMGCSSGGNTFVVGGGGNHNTTNIDLAVGDRSGFVALYFDILGFTPSTDTPFPAPDVILDNVGSGISRPRKMILTRAGDLFVCDPQSDRVSIFRNYKTLTDGAAPDVTFTSSGAITGSPVDCVLDESLDILMVSEGGKDRGIDAVTLFYDVSQVAAGTDPVVTTVELNNAGSLINDPNGVATAGGDLYVANYANNGTNPSVTIYRDIVTLANADAPDVQLSSDVSFLQTTGSTDADKLLVVNDTLYVATFSDAVFVFEGASTLSTDALPDAVFAGLGTGLSNAMGLAVVTNTSGDRTLWVGNENCRSGAQQGLSAFFAPTNGAFTTLQTPSTILGSSSYISGYAQEIRSVGGALLFQATDQNCNFESIYIYRDAFNISSDQIADIIIPGGQGSSLFDLNSPNSIDAIAVDAGT